MKEMREQVIHLLQGMDETRAWKGKKRGLLFNKDVLLGKLQGVISEFCLVKSSTSTVLKLLLVNSRVMQTLKSEDWAVVFLFFQRLPEVKAHDYYFSPS